MIKEEDGTEAQREGHTLGGLSACPERVWHSRWAVSASRQLA